MNKVIGFLETEIEKQQDHLVQYQANKDNEKATLHFEYVHEIGEDIQNLKRAIAILKSYSA